MPDLIFVYVCDCIDGEPVYAVAKSKDDIPLDSDGQKVGVYALRETLKFDVKTELK